MPLIYLDTNVFIRCFETGLADAEPLHDLLIALRTMPDEAVTSELTIAELYAPVKRPGALSSASRIHFTAISYFGEASSSWQSSTGRC